MVLHATNTVANGIKCILYFTSIFRGSVGGGGNFFLLRQFLYFFFKFSFSADVIYLHRQLTGNVYTVVGRHSVFLNGRLLFTVPCTYSNINGMYTKQNQSHLQNDQTIEKLPVDEAWRGRGTQPKDHCPQSETLSWDHTIQL